MLLGVGDQDSSDTRRETLIAAMVLLALAYYVGVRIGFAFTLPTNAVSLLWPPNAVLLAALLLCARRAWIWPLLAVLPAHLIAEISGGVPLAMACCWYISNASEAMLGAAIILGILGEAPQFARVRDVSVYLLAAAVVAPVLTSFLDAGFVALVGWRYDGDYWHVFRLRLLSGALAAILVPPLIVTVVRDGPALLRNISGWRFAESVVLLGGLGAASFAVFHQPWSTGEAALYVYTPLPLLIWATVRIGTAGVVGSVAVVAFLAITGTLGGMGPFVLAGADTAVLSLQIFLIITASTLMLLAAALAELRKARATALRSKERLDMALSAAHMGAWEWDLLSDRISCRLISPSGEIVSRAFASAADMLEAVDSSDRGRVLAAMHAAREKGEVGEVECRFHCAQGVRWIRGLGRVQRSDAGRPMAMIGVCIDTTRLKNQEIHQRGQREKLARLARAATLGELSGALAHELSQPLAAIMINARAAQLELSKASPSTPELGSIVADIEADDRRAAEVINRLRALFPRGPVETEQVQVAECIHSILALEHSGLIARNVAVDLRIDPALPPVNAAHAQLQQVLLNLIVNACEAMAGRSSERRLQIAARHQGAEVRLEVSDNGSGVEDFERIFEPFFSTRTHGVGLGLSISRTIVAAYGGRLWGTNNETGGATFHVALPAFSAAPPA